MIFTLGKLKDNADYEELKKTCNLRMVIILQKMLDKDQTLETRITQLLDTLDIDQTPEKFLTKILLGATISKDSTNVCLLYFNDMNDDKNFRLATYGNTHTKGNPILIQIINKLGDQFQWQ